MELIFGNLIHKALTFTCTQLDKYVKAKLGELNGEKRVKLTNLVKQDGTVDHLPQNTVLCSLINVEQEKVANREPYKMIKDGDTFSRRNADLNLNLYLLFVTYFNDYEEDLKFLSHVVTFFQDHNVFIPDGSEVIQPPGKLIFELYTPNFEQINQLWGALGAKYAPSVIYKMKILSIESSVEMEEVESIRRVRLRSRNPGESSLDEIETKSIRRTKRKQKKIDNKT